jgi:hypothetical protein
LGSDGPFIRRSAKIRSWEKAEEFKRKLESEDGAKQNGGREAVDVTPENISVKDAVARFISSKRNENLAESTLDKLKTIFEKQFLSWATESRLKHLEDITTADLEAFRDTWEDGPLSCGQCSQGLDHSPKRGQEVAQEATAAGEDRLKDTNVAVLTCSSQLSMHAQQDGLRYT